MSKKQQRRPSARPDEILDAALQVFTAKGFTAARMDDIAEKAGITKGSVYLYFPSKEKLFEELIDRFASQVMSVLVAQLERDGPKDPASALRQFLGGALFLLSNAEASAAPRLALMEAGRSDLLANIYREKVIEVGKKVLSGILEEGRSKGVFKPLETDVALRLVVGPLLAHMALTHFFKVTPDQPADAFQRAFVDGIMGSICKEAS